MSTHNSHLDVLAAAGLEFTAPARGQKGPRNDGWPKIRLTPADVLPHLAAGGNLGAHCTGYQDGRTLAYFDADDAAGLAALLAVAPDLTNTLRSWRASGSGKVLVWVDQPFQKQYTPDLAGDHTKRELICTGQATIFGVHPSGQAYQTNWLPPIHLTIDQVKRIWRRWTGQAWREKPTPATRPEGASHRTDATGLDAIKAAWPPLAVFQRFGYANEAEPRHNGEVKLGGHGGLLVKGSEWYSHADQVGGDCITAWAWCRRLDARRDFLTIVDEMADAAGVPRIGRASRQTPAIAETYDAVRGFRAWTQTPAAIAEIHARCIEAELTARGVLGMQRTLQAIAELAVQNVTFRIVGVSARKLAEMTAQSHVSAGKQLSRLAELGFVALTDAGVVEIRQNAESYHQNVTVDSGNFQQPGSLAATLGDDFFAVGGSMAAALARRTAPAVLLRSAGPAARHVWSALHEAAYSAAGLAAATGLTLGSVRGAVSRLAELGLIDSQRGAHGRRIWQLITNAAARLEQIRPHTTTYANTQRRVALHAGERAAHLHRQLFGADISEVARLKMRIEQEMQRAAAIKTWLAEAGILPAKGYDFDAARFNRQRIADRRQEGADLRGLAHQFAGMNREDAARMAQMAGWSAAEVAQAWSYRQVTA